MAAPKQCDFTLSFDATIPMDDLCAVTSGISWVMLMKRTLTSSKVFIVNKLVSL